MFGMSSIRSWAKNKTHMNKPVVGFIYAISALDGLPVTYSVFRGSRIDSKQIHLIVDYLKSYDMQISGVILNRGFAMTKPMLDSSMTVRTAQPGRAICLLSNHTGKMQSTLPIWL